MFEPPIEMILDNRAKEIKKIDRAISKKKMVLLYGGAGVGKTVLARAYFKHEQYTTVHADGYFTIAPEMIPQSAYGLTGEAVAFHIDELDRGKEENFANLLQYLFVVHRNTDGDITSVTTRVPTIVTCNNEKKIQLPEEYYEKINIKPLSIDDIAQVLVANEIGESTAMDKANACGGDIRAALNNSGVKNYTKKETISQSQFIKNFLRKDPPEAARYLDKHNVGEYGGMMGFEWLISILARNVDEKYKMKSLEKASKLKYTINKDMLYHVISMICPIYVEKVKFPGKTDTDHPYYKKSSRNATTERAEASP